MAASKQRPFFTKAASFTLIFASVWISVYDPICPSACSKDVGRLHKTGERMEGIEHFELPKRNRIDQGADTKDSEKMERTKIQPKSKAGSPDVKISSGRNKPILKTRKRRRLESIINDSRKIPKQSAACSISKCNAVCSTNESTKRFGSLNEEEAAIGLTRVNEEDWLPNRRLRAFTIHDENGELQSIDMVGESNLYISAVVLPLEDVHDSEKETRIRCERFGPIISWSLSGYDDNSPVIWISTHAADYECLEPAKVYQKQYGLFFQKASACIDVYRRLSVCYEGNPNLSLDDLITGVVHSWRGNENIPLVFSTKDLFISWGRFIHDQLIGLDETSPKGDTIFTNLPVLVALRDASDKEVGLASTRKEYLVSESTKLADDYPPQTFYRKSIKEIDECSIFKDDHEDSDQLPQHALQNWCLYSLDGKFISLELLPMRPSSDKDPKIFCSGVMATDGVIDSNFSTPRGKNTDGIPVRLSEIKEWNVEWRSSSASISVQTDRAWYMLGNPSPQYSPWFNPVLKTVTLAVSIVRLLEEQRRASRLSFKEVIEKVSDLNESHPGYISSDPKSVQRYMLFRGKILLQLFENHPDSSIRRCAFVRGLSDNIKEMHLKFATKKKLRRKEANVNQEDSMSPEMSETKAMPATTTKLIHRIWGEYCLNYLPGGFQEKYAKASKDKKVPLRKLVQESHSVPRQRKLCGASAEIRWDVEQVGKMTSGEVFYKQAIVSGVVVPVGSSVLVETADSKKDPPIFLLEYMFEESGARKVAHGRLMLRGYQTVLGDDSGKRELFLTNHCLEFDLCHVIGTLSVELRPTLWGHQHRKTNANTDHNDKAKAANRKRKGPSMEFFCRSLYCPEKGAFLCLRTDTIGLGNGHCDSCEAKESLNKFLFKLRRSSFTYQGNKYHVHDFIYLDPHHPSFEESGHKTPMKERHVLLKPFAIAQILSIEHQKSFKNADPESTILRLRRFFRPEDVSADKAHRSDIRELYYSKQVIKLPVETVKGKCDVRKKEEMHQPPTTYVYQHIFFCEQIYEPQTGALKKLSHQVTCSLSRNTLAKAVVNRKITGKRKLRERGLKGISNQGHSAHKRNLATLDIFSGCGGLSSGLEQSGVSTTKWAIDYEQEAGEAFKLNHPRAKMFTRNCNVILRAIMTACGDEEDCISTSEAAKLAANLEQKEINDLPRPGEVDFIVGGPPCQGFSKMNRFNKGSWSKVQCEMILAFLSFADYLRPRFFLLENVRNFISFGNGQIFRFTLAALLEMGYQVRFGILEAGAYGVAQNRKRAFIWAASPEENLPEWPEPMYVFKGPTLKIPLRENIQYAAVRSTENGAPFRAITVRDTIGDLPSVSNGALKPTMQYKNEPVSWFQRQIRGDKQDLNDHISKKLNELNLLRCQKIPERPGADWHDLPDKKVKLSNGKVVKLIPSWLPGTARRNNEWKGLYGRLDWAGKFPTCVTDPQPMGKVGRWFHPHQDRLLTVREYARAQGFPDSYQFAGNIHHKHRQVGNAVPPPLAFALGRKLKEAIEKRYPDST